MAFAASLASRVRCGPSTDNSSAVMPNTRTQTPIVTGTSVVAIKYKGGVMLAADTLGSYGSLSRFKNIKRVTTINNILIAADGDLGDFEYLTNLLRSMEVQERCIADGITYTPTQIYARMASLLYQRRTKMDPIWNNLVIAGMHEGKPFLGTTDKIGTKYEANYVATGIGLHLATPILYARWREDLSEDEARKLLEDCMRVLYYRDCRTINNITFAQVNDKACGIEEPVKLQTEWNYEAFRRVD